MRGIFTNKTLILLALMLIGLSSTSGCRKREVVSLVATTGDVKFCIASSTHKMNVGSRAVTDENNDFTRESQIGIYATKADEFDVSLALPENTNVGYGNPSGSTQWPVIDGIDPIKFFADDQAMNFFAYHPYIYQPGTSVTIDPNVISPTLIYTLPLNQSTLSALTVADLMWGKKLGVSESSGIVSLEFEHILSKISFKITAGSDWESEDVTISRIELKGTEIPATAKLNISSGNFTSGGERNTVIFSDFNPAMDIDVRNSSECQFITIPTEISDIELVVTARGRVTGEKIYQATLPNVQLKAGHLRQITMSLFKHSGLSITLSSTIDPWDVISDISMEAI